MELKDELINKLEKINYTKWKYNTEDDVYWQVGISYCTKPADEEYETLGIYVPGLYMVASDNGDGTYTCMIDKEAKVGKYTAETAPIVIPVDTPGYSAMAAPKGYNSKVGQYTKMGFVYVNAGCRGRDAGAPAGVTDLKAAVRYIRYNESEMPGDVERIFTFGMSGGGAQSALMGVTGNSKLYTPYLEAIGAVLEKSDAIAGSMCWCPITNLDYADEAYEWNMGVTRTGLDDETKQLSDRMAEAFAKYVNQLQLKDKDGKVFTLTESDKGIYQSGSYYEYLKGIIEESLNHFLEDTTFPYAEQNVEKNSVQDYIDAFNTDTTWINYDSKTNTVTITSIADFVAACKKASKSIGAFDDLDNEKIENILFGYGDGTGAHFDSVMAELLADHEKYGKAYKEDFKKTDALGNTVDYRVNMYNPMYYLNGYYEGYGKSDVAKYWRIRTGIFQEDTALSTEVNLALALKNYKNTEVDFETVWGQGHVEAERTGDSTTNFIKWVEDCLNF